MTRSTIVNTISGVIVFFGFLWIVYLINEKERANIFIAEENIRFAEL
jgi:hypothetical protein